MRSIFIATTMNRFGIIKDVKVLFLFVLMSACFTSSILAGQDTAGKPTKEEIVQKTRTLQMPFIANNGQVDGQVAFYAKTFGGTVFVTKDGEIVYALPDNNNISESGVQGFGSDSIMHKHRGQSPKAGIQDNRASRNSPPPHRFKPIMRP